MSDLVWFSDESGDAYTTSEKGGVTLNVSEGTATKVDLINGKPHVTVVNEDVQVTLVFDEHGDMSKVGTAMLNGIAMRIGTDRRVGDLLDREDDGDIEP